MLVQQGGMPNHEAEQKINTEYQTSAAKQVCRLGKSRSDLRDFPLFLGVDGITIWYHISGFGC